MLEPGIWRGVFTVFMFVSFIGIVIWAYSSRRKSEFDEMANMPLEQDSFVAEHGKPAGIVPQGEDES